MSGYSSLAEVRRVTVATLIQEGRDPEDYNISRIMRDAFHERQIGYGYGAEPESVWREAVARHLRLRTEEREL